MKTIKKRHQAEQGKQDWGVRAQGQAARGRWDQERDLCITVPHQNVASIEVLWPLSQHISSPLPRERPAVPGFLNVTDVRLRKILLNLHKFSDLYVHIRKFMFLFTNITMFCHIFTLLRCTFSVFCAISCAKLKFWMSGLYLGRLKGAAKQSSINVRKCQQCIRKFFFPSYFFVFETFQSKFFQVCLICRTRFFLFNSDCRLWAKSAEFHRYKQKVF